ncbi:hypothetical protein JS562_54275, partial [Agrobacterium sp. S2]|nr:hypothetical protein [Agrobacterium sp. S2]
MTDDGAASPAWNDLAELVSSAERRVSLVSPFITFPVAARLAEVAAGSSASWSLLTALSPVAVANGFLSTAGLSVLLNAGVMVRSSTRLHAKAYLADDRGLVGSANLTRTGLGLVEPANLEL